MNHPSGQTVLGDALAVLSRIPDGAVSLVWTDPPHNTGKRQALASSGRSYLDDRGDGYLPWLRDVYAELRRTLAGDGVLVALHDPFTVHEAKAVLDGVFGRGRFRGEVIWHSQIGRAGTRWWVQKHWTMLTYAKTDSPRWNLDGVPHIPRAGGPVRRRVRGHEYEYSPTRRVNSVWHFTMNNNNAQRVGYPNQKPVEIVRPFITAHTDPGDYVLDPFCGSGTVAAAAAETGRRFIAIDSNPEAMKVTRARIARG